MGVDPRSRAAVDTNPCSGCHTGDFADFDHYCDANSIAMEDTGPALAAWLNLRTGWDGEASRVESRAEESSDG